jgi:H+/Cl- antiporter ClcA
MRSRPFMVLLVLAAIVGVLVSLAAWCFLELVYQLQQELYTHLPHALGYSSAPTWWPLPVLVLFALIVALAIVVLPGDGGHIPARGLAVGGRPEPIGLPGVILAGVATIGSGLILGPEAPLIALGGGLGVLAIRAMRRNAEDQVVMVVAAAGSFAALSFVFSSPLIGAVVLIEASGVGGTRLPVILLPGLMAAGIGSLISLGIGSFTGLSNSAYALSALPLPKFDHLHVANFGWTIALAIVISIACQLIMRGGLLTYRIAAPRPWVVLPIVGLIIAGLAIAYSQITGHSINDILFSGQDDLPVLTGNAAKYSVGALALMIALKGIGYSLSLGSFRGGPTFPALFLGAAAGIVASHLPGFPLTPAVAVGMAAGVASVLRLPLSAVIIATVLVLHSGEVVGPLVIVSSVVAYLVALILSAPRPETR